MFPPRTPVLWHLPSGDETLADAIVRINKTPRTMKSCIMCVAPKLFGTWVRKGDFEQRKIKGEYSPAGLFTETLESGACDFILGQGKTT